MSFRSILADLRFIPPLSRPRPAGRRAGVHARRTVLAVVALEDRTVPSTFTVQNLADSGTGSLRQAILDANAHPGTDVIRFDHAARERHHLPGQRGARHHRRA